MTMEDGDIMDDEIDALYISRDVNIVTIVQTNICG